MSDETEVFWIDYYGTVSYSSMVALVVYDYSITIDREVENIWKKKFNLSSWIFIINRYATLFAASGIATFQMFPRTRLRLVSRSGCFFCIINNFYSCLGLWFSTIMASVILQTATLCFYIIRTWAIWGQHPLPPLVLTPLAISVITLNGLFNLAQTYEGISPLQSPYGGCILSPTISNELLNRDGTIQLCLSFILNILEATLFNVDSEAADIVVLIGPITWLTHVIVSRMILDLKTIDQITMASIPDLAGLSNRFSSIHFVGNIGAPLDTLSIREPSDNDMGESFEITTSVITVSAKQAIENPLSIGLLDERYDMMSSGSQTGLAIGA
ncbi:hypothetical protein ABKN59_005416 [Abortiporus biennis]